MLNPNGNFVIVGGSKGNWFGPLMSPIKALVLSPFVGQNFVMLLARLNKEDLTILRDLMAAGKIKPVIDSHFPLSEVPAAIRHSEEGHARGKIVIDVN